jgi:predicted short-subunit dehydrogenase-like oxidoreductase (DUF2520 family)
MTRAPSKRGWAHARTAGLISSGGVSQSLLARLPSFLSTIGPVKAASLRVARRLTNTLRAGRAVENYSDLDECRTIWIAVPDTAVDRVSRELASNVSASGKMVVLCTSNFDSATPGPLRIAGAHVASLNPMDPDARTLVAEGHSDVVRELKRLAAADKRKLIEIRPAAKCLYLGGVHLSTHLVLPWIAAALESLRAAGFSRSEAAEAVSYLSDRSVRAYAKAGRRAWSVAAETDLRNSIDRDLDSIRAKDPRLAALYAAGVSFATRFFAG